VTYRVDCNASESARNLSPEILDLVIEQGIGALPEALRILVDAAMQIERERHLGVGPYERSEERRGHANGFKPKTVKTRVGEVTFRIPQVREGGFYPASLEKGCRSERALKVALGEMYVQGVSTRKVAAITEALCGIEVSSSQVSRAAAALDVELEAWRQRPLGAFRYVELDARYEKVRHGGVVIDEAVLVAVGIDPLGYRHVLGTSVSLSEAEVHWRKFLESLLKRGLKGVQFVVSDDHPGLKAALRATLGGVTWQRCQFHLQSNAQAYVPKQELKAPVARDLRAVFNAPDRAEAEALLHRTVERYRKSAPALADWMESNVPEGFAVFGLPESHRRKLRTSNLMERLNEEIKRRTRVARLFPNDASLLRLVSALLMETSEEWQTGRAYVTFED